MLKAKNLQKDYGNFTALKDINMSVQKGEVLALLGPNGAGKTTTMKILTGFLDANHGEVEIDEEILTANNVRRIQNKIGYLPENAPLYPDLNIWEHLDFAADIHGIPADEKTKAIDKVVKVCGLKEKLYFDISQLSKGYKQRLGLAQALIHDPEILILDEPTTGLDPNQIIEIRNFIDSLRKKKTIILSTHIMQEVEALADRVIVINQGEVVAEGTPDSLMQGTSLTHKTKISIKGSLAKAKKELEKLEGVDKIEKEPSPNADIIVLNIFTTENMQALISKTIVNADIDLLEIKTEKEKMEDIFQKLTSKK